MDSLLSVLWKLCSSDRPYATAVTRPGVFEANPEISCTLIVPGPDIISAQTGPDVGVAELQHQLRDFTAPWQQAAGSSDNSSTKQQHSPAQPQNVSKRRKQQPQQPQQQQAWGQAVSLYDRDPQTGLRCGEPIADCFGVLTYENGAVLALADGVNWGERPKVAARAAVYAFLRHVHQMMLHLHAKNWSSSECFDIMRGAVQAAQQQIKRSDGTLTTLVAAVVAPQKWGPGHSLMTVMVGDSPAFVWRAGPGRVEEISYMPPLYGLHRDPRVCPGCLGYAVGDSADLSNITFSITSLEEGDLVFLTSDGIADNFDPVIRKQATQATGLPGKSPGMSAGGRGSGGRGLPSLSAASCHEAALADMADVLRLACQQPQQHYPHKHQHYQQHQQQDHGGPCGMAAAAAAAAAAGGGSHAGSTLLATIREASITDSKLSAAADEQGGTPHVTTQTAGAMEAQQQTASNLGNSSMSSSGGSSDSSSSRGFAHARHLTPAASLTPAALVSSLISFAVESTAAQRALLEAPGRGAMTQALSDAVSDLPGKMDHACAVAYLVGPKKGSRAPSRNWLKPQKPGSNV